MDVLKFAVWSTLAWVVVSAVDRPAVASDPVAGVSSPTAGPPLDAGFRWSRSTPGEQGMDEARLRALEKDLARRRTKALLVIRGDAIVLEWYAPGHGVRTQHYAASLIKPVAGMSLAMAMQDGLMSLDDPVHRFVPEWKDDPVRRKITIRQLATNSSGLEDADSTDVRARLDDLDGWKGDFWRGRRLGRVGLVHAERNPFTISLREAPVQFEPGTRYGYSNPGVAVLAMAVTAALAGTREEDVRTLLRERIMRRIGVPDAHWNIGYGRTFVTDGLPVVMWGGGGFTARALARLGRLMKNQGSWQGRQLLSPDWIRTMLAHDGVPLPERGPNDRYPAPAMLWYTNAEGAWEGVPRDAFSGAGAGNQHLLVVPSLDLIVVRNGSALSPDPGDRAWGEGFWSAAYDHLIKPVVASIDEGGS